MTTYNSTTGHRTSPHAHFGEDGDERPLPARKAKPAPSWERIFGVAVAKWIVTPPTFNEVFGWLCDKQHANPDYITDARFRSLVHISEQSAAKLTALYAHALSAQIEAVYAGETA